MKTVPQNLPKNPSAFDLEAAERIAIAEGKKQENNQEFAQELPRNPSLFDLEAAELIAKAKKAASKKNDREF